REAVGPTGGVRHLPPAPPACLVRPRPPHLPRHAPGAHGDHRRHGDDPRPPPQDAPRPRGRRRPHPRPSLPLPPLAASALRLKIPFWRSAGLDVLAVLVAVWRHPRPPEGSGDATAEPQ